MKAVHQLSCLLVGVSAIAIAHDAGSSRVYQGIGSSQPPYLLPAAPGVHVASLLTAGDAVDGYRMSGIPDGLGAFDNHDGTFTLLMNHELPATAGVVRAHGARGAFVSKWLIEKHTLRVVKGEDLMRKVYSWTAGGWTLQAGAQLAYARFCSADLPAASAFYDRRSGKGTRERLYMNGEESGVEGRALAHVVTGPQAGESYELPWLGRFAWENAVAKPDSGEATVVVGTDDGQGNQVYVYIGAKTSAGNAVEAAGLTNGTLYGVKIAGIGAETDATSVPAGTRFSLVPQGDAAGFTGAQLDNLSAFGTVAPAAGAARTFPVTSFQRPEDSSWDPSDARNLYLATTGSFTARSRLWRLRFDDPRHPELGGVATIMIDGPAFDAALGGLSGNALNAAQPGPRMIDNITVNRRGELLLQEDVGNNAYLGGVWQYAPRRNELRKVLQFDATRFGAGAAGLLTLDEESSGVIPARFLGEDWYLLDAQNHAASSDAALVEGGQLLAVRIPSIEHDDDEAHEGRDED